MPQGRTCPRAKLSSGLNLPQGRTCPRAELGPRANLISGKRSSKGWQSQGRLCHRADLAPLLQGWLCPTEDFGLEKKKGYSRRSDWVKLGQNVLRWFWLALYLSYRINRVKVYQNLSNIIKNGEIGSDCVKLVFCQKGIIGSHCILFGQIVFYLVKLDFIGSKWIRLSLIRWNQANWFWLGQFWLKVSKLVKLGLIRWNWNFGWKWYKWVKLSLIGCNWIKLGLIWSNWIKRVKVNQIWSDWVNVDSISS